MRPRRNNHALLLFLVPLLIGCNLPTLATGQATPTASAVSLRKSYGPSDLRLAYDVNPLLRQGFTGKGQTVVDIVSFGDPTIQTDLDDYSQSYGIPSVRVRVIAPMGANPQPTSSAEQTDQENWATETALDVEMIHALSPDAGIVVLTIPIAEKLYFPGLSQFRQLVQYAIDNKLGNIITNSWQAPEDVLTDDSSQADLQQWETLLQTATTTQGVTVLAASGDYGAADQPLNIIPTIGFPCDSPWTTCVGGTSLTFIGSQRSETVWNGDGGAGGGGFSSFYVEPDYQKTVPPPAQTHFFHRRGVPDVAAVADPSPGLAIYIHGRFAVKGGTSAAAPMWAALIAIANQMAGKPLGFINPRLYQIGTSSRGDVDFHDITSGDNSFKGLGLYTPGYSAAPGWDAASGFGSPDAAKLIPDLIAAAP